MKNRNKEALVIFSHINHKSTNKPTNISLEFEKLTSEVQEKGTNNAVIELLQWKYISR